MDTYTCSACQKTLTISDFTTGEVRQRDGKLFCMNCMIGAKHVNRIVCPKCGLNDAPLFDGKSYLCRRCAAPISLESDLAPVPVRPAPVDAEKKCPFCAQLIPAEAFVCSHCNSSLQGTAAYPAIPVQRPSPAPTVLLVLALLLVAGVAVYAIIFSQQIISSQQEGERSPRQEVISVVDDELRQATQELTASLQKANIELAQLRKEYNSLSENLPKNLLEQVKNSEDRFDSRLQTTSTHLNGLQLAISKLSNKQADLADKLGLLKASQPPTAAELTSATVAAAAEKPGVQKITGPQSKTESAKQNGSLDDFFKAEDTAMAAHRNYDYGRAIRAYDQFLARHPESAYTPHAKLKKTWYETEAQRVFDEVKVQADKFIVARKWDDALKLYKTVMEFGVEELTGKAQAETRNITALKAESNKESIQFEGAPKTTSAAPKQPTSLPPRKTPSVTTTSKKEKLPQETARLIEILENERTPSKKVRQAIQTLTTRPGNKVTAALVGALEHDDWMVQKEVLGALSTRGDRTVVERLIPMLNHKLLPVQESARNCLKQLTGVDRGNSQDSWKVWWAQNRERLGVPRQEGSDKSGTAPKMNFKDTAGSKKNQPKILGLKPEQNVVIFSLAHFVPAPQIGDVLNIVRNNGLVGKIEVMHLAPGIGVGKGLIVDEVDGKVIKVNDFIEK